MSDIPGANTLAPEIEQLPVNRPASGTFGEQAQTDRLRQSLPQSGSAGPAQGSAPPASPPVDPGNAPGPGGPPAGPLPGVPEILTRPGGPPPPSMPFSPQPGAADPNQARIGYLHTIASSPDVSEATKEWANMALRRLIGS